jgi:hypothetical protein
MVLETVQVSPLEYEVALGNLSILLHEHHKAWSVVQHRRLSLVIVMDQSLPWELEVRHHHGRLRRASWLPNFSFWLRRLNGSTQHYLFRTWVSYDRFFRYRRVFKRVIKVFVIILHSTRHLAHYFFISKHVRWYLLLAILYNCKLRGSNCALMSDALFFLE